MPSRSPHHSPALFLFQSQALRAGLRGHHGASGGGPMAAYPLAPPIHPVDMCYNLTGYSNVTVPGVALTFLSGATVELARQPVRDSRLTTTATTSQPHRRNVNQRTFEVLCDSMVLYDSMQLSVGRWVQSWGMLKLSSWFFLLLALIGGVYATAFSFRFLAYLALCVRRPMDPRRRYGAWAVVTGPTSGIGRSVAKELARRGLNLVLLDHDAANLKETSDMIRSRYAIKTRTVVFDLSLVGTPQGDEPMRRLRAAIEGLEVGVLVNNAGVARPCTVFFHEADVEAWVRMIKVNLWAPTEVTAAVLPGMVERGRGAVVNTGSASSEAIPSMIPSLVRRKWFLSPLFSTADDYARAAVRWIGHGALCTPTVSHQLQWCFAGVLPESVFDWLLLRLVLGLRAETRVGTDGSRADWNN
ncbi:hypothetical protein HU200_060109 [Digitaria exilis]|uniref:Uncharacterized protein n=1 Tax=Digitaria exilis TaxID=1010633 RepID=A0A835A9T1_9POAL|nr:hypothetical protein HU200_060109 [Digitaria exilis]